MENNKQYRTDPSQIAFLSNRKTLVAACDYLQPPDLNGDPDKCPASLHARYSRIKINVTDFEKNPTVFLSFNLDPSEIRLLHQKICMITMTEREFEWGVTKNYGTFGSDRMDMISISRKPLRNGQKANYPWSISISSGKTAADKKFQPEKSARKLLSDDEIQRFFGDIMAYISVWEMTFGAPFIRNVIEPYKAKRKEEQEQARRNAREAQPAAGGQYGYSTQQAPSYDEFDDEPL